MSLKRRRVSNPNGVSDDPTARAAISGAMEGGIDMRSQLQKYVHLRETRPEQLLREHEEAVNAELNERKAACDAYKALVGKLEAEVRELQEKCKELSAAQPPVAEPSKSDARQEPAANAGATDENDRGDRAPSKETPEVVKALEPMSTDAHSEAPEPSKAAVVPGDDSNGVAAAKLPVNAPSVSAAGSSIPEVSDKVDLVSKEDVSKVSVVTELLECFTGMKYLGLAPQMASDDEFHKFAVMHPTQGRSVEFSLAFSTDGDCTELVYVAQNYNLPESSEGEPILDPNGFELCRAGAPVFCRDILKRVYAETKPAGVRNRRKSSAY